MYPYERHCYDEEQAECSVLLLPTHTLPTQLQLEPSCVSCHDECHSNFVAGRSMMAERDLVVLTVCLSESGMVLPLTYEIH